MDTWVFSDSHFLHSKIAAYCGRPDDWEERLWGNITTRIKPTDTVLFLGDLVFCKRKDIDRMVAKLPGGRLILVEGNHDIRNSLKRSKYWDEVYPCGSVYSFRVHRGDEIINVAASHKPEDVLEEDFRHDIYLHGHIHNKSPAFTLLGNGRLQVNCSVEALDYEPINLTEIVDFYEWYNGNPKSHS